MSFFVISFMLNIKKFATKKALWLGLILLPAALALGGIFVQTELPVITVNVGVFYNPQNPLEARIFEALEESVSANPFISFIPYDNLDALLTDVRLGQIECGYIFGPNIENALIGEFSEIVTLVTSPRTIAAPILNDIVTSAILQATVEDITKHGLVSIFGESDELTHFVAWQFEAYNQMDIFMTPYFVGEAGEIYIESRDILEMTLSRLFHGLIGLTILIISLFFAPMFIEERRYNLKAALRLHKKLSLYELSLWAAAMLVMFAIGITGLFAMVIFAPHLLASGFVEITALLAYTAVCAIILVLAARFFKSAGFIQSFGLFIVILNIFFGGVLLDLSELNPHLGQLQRLFPLYWYIDLVIY